MIGFLAFPSLFVSLSRPLKSRNSTRVYSGRPNKSLVVSSSTTAQDGRNNFTRPWTRPRSSRRRQARECRHRQPPCPPRSFACSGRTRPACGGRPGSRGPAGSGYRERVRSAPCPRRCRRWRRCWQERQRGLCRKKPHVSIIVFDGLPFHVMSCVCLPSPDFDLPFLSSFLQVVVIMGRRRVGLLVECLGGVHQKHTLGGSEVNHVAIALEHVDLLNSLDGLHVELLERLLQLLVVGAGPGGRALHLSAGSALSSDPCGSTELLEAFLNVGHCGMCCVD